MVSCCVKHCKNVKRLLPPESKITFHRIPKEMFHTFMEILGLEETKYRVRYICSLHFNDDDIVTTKNNYHYLRKGAVPALHLSIDEDDKFVIVLIPHIKPPSVSEMEGPSHGPEKRIRRHSSSSTMTVSSPEKETMSESDAQSSSETSSLSNGTKTQRRQLVKAVHSYSISPRKMKTRIEAFEKKLTKSSKLLYKQKQQITYLKQKVRSLQEIIDKLRNERMVTDSIIVGQ